MFRPVLVTAPATTPITLAEAKAHCRIDEDDEDDLVTAFIQAAVDHLDGYTGVLGRCLVTQTWSISVANWSDMVRLPFPDCSSVSVVYNDTDGQEQTVSTSLFWTLEDAVSSDVCFGSEFTSPSLNDEPEPITIQFDSGFGDANAVPAAIKTAMLLLVSHWNENRRLLVIAAP